MVRDNKYWYLRNHRLFEQLTELEVADLCIVSNMKNAEKNEVIYFSGDDYNRIYLIKVGTVKICREDQHVREMITELLTEGDIFGHIGNGTNSEEYAKVLSESVRLCFFETSNFTKVLQKNPNLSLKYTDAVNEKMISFRQKFEDLAFKPVDTRVYEFFKRYAQYHGKFNENRVEMDMMLTHQDIAAYTASSRQSVTSIINRLAEEGKIVYEGRKKVIIPDVTLL